MGDVRDDAAFREFEAAVAELEGLVGFREHPGQTDDDARWEPVHIALDVDDEAPAVVTLVVEGARYLLRREEVMRKLGAEDR